MTDRPGIVVHLLSINLETDESCKARGTVRCGEIINGVTLHFTTVDGETFEVTVSDVRVGGKHIHLALKGDAVRHLVAGHYLYAQ